VIVADLIQYSGQVVSQTSISGLDRHLLQLYRNPVRLDAAAFRF
jgi:hypothetical protein